MSWSNSSVSLDRRIHEGSPLSGVDQAERCSELQGCDLLRVMSVRVQEHLSGGRHYRVLSVVEGRHHRYNIERRHSSIGMLPPAVFETLHPDQTSTQDDH